MPTLKLETNSRIPEEKIAKLSKSLAAAVAGATGEPPGAFRVELAADQRMRMADSDTPVAHVTIQGLDFPKDKAALLTGALCPLLENQLGIDGNRVYIAVVSMRSSMWRVNGETAS